jgi:hypothetical protein
MVKNHAISIYGVATKKITQKEYTYQQRKRIEYTNKKGKQISYLRRTGKTITIPRHINTTKAREARFTIFGSAKDVKEAYELIIKNNLVPKKQYEDGVPDGLPARTYTRLAYRDKKGKYHPQKTIVGILDHPEKYSKQGEWQKKDTKATT